MVQCVEMQTRDYINRFNRRQEFEVLCKECGNWAKRWGCPPFNTDQIRQIERFDHVKLYCLSAGITTWPDGAGIKEMSEALDRIRRSWEPELLIAEQQMNGLAALFTGMCYHCGNQVCARINDEPCRHPEKVRPSLEALGFDLSKTATDIFQTNIEWFHPSHPTPRKLTLLAGIFH